MQEREWQEFQLNARHRTVVSRFRNVHERSTESDGVRKDGHERRDCQ
jgi:hypothetical protein